jgi:hypothetical protein
MTELKSISAAAIPVALEKALRYRLLNEPLEAESICRDILAADPDNREALVTLVLALTDLFDEEYVSASVQAKALLPRLSTEYERAYYEGIVHERWAKAEAHRHVPDHVVAGWIRRAMRCFERAEHLSPPQNPDAVLRWNTCARLLARYESHPAQAAPMTHDVEAAFGDETG